MCAHRCIVSENLLTNRLQARVFGEHPPKQGDASHKNVLGGVEVGPFQQVVSHGVGGGVRIGPDGFGHSCVELADGPNGVGSNLTAIQGSGEDKSPNNSLLVHIVPTEVTEPDGKVSATVNAVVERAPVQPGACRNVRAEVPKMQDDLNTSVLMTGHTRAASLARVVPQVANK